ncbi:unnamed protein product [Gongylonema pulchrum]|uniref:Uncharacterized protein n=1 Tax=Gongylonema pulchrum TaxID=637853 RepID=A0A183EGK8_9BILA|nr:unnamed protein product [Gongylonema pulchrum]
MVLKFSKNLIINFNNEWMQVNQKQSKSWVNLGKLRTKLRLLKTQLERQKMRLVTREMMRKWLKKLLYRPRKKLKAFPRLAFGKFFRYGDLYAQRNLRDCGGGLGILGNSYNSCLIFVLPATFLGELNLGGVVPENRSRTNVVKSLQEALSGALHLESCMPAV